MKIWRDVNDEFQVKMHTKVCFFHFSEDSSYPGKHKRTSAAGAGNTTSQSRSRLRPNAVPMIFEWRWSGSHAECSAVLVLVKRHRREVETEKAEQSADKEADERENKESSPLACAKEGYSRLTQQVTHMNMRIATVWKR